MLRSLFAVIAAVLAGLATVRFVEKAGMAGLALDGAVGGEAPPAAYQALLVAGWGAGAFVAAVTALLLGRRWAPVGWLAAATVLFAACMTMLTFSLSWILWPAALVVTAFGGFLAIRLLRASNVLPAKGREREFFGD